MNHYQPAPNLLKDRIILVTGVADTLGRAVAEACARCGATVILSDLKEEDLEPPYDTIEAVGCPVRATRRAPGVGHRRRIHLGS